MREPTPTTLGALPIRRLVVGLWQMADQERDGKAFDLDRAAEDLLAYARAGFDAFDMADHYGSAEIVAGMVHKAMREAGERPPTILTKWCPPPGPMDAGTVRQGRRDGARAARHRRRGPDAVPLVALRVARVPRRARRTSRGCARRG